MGSLAMVIQILQRNDQPDHNTQQGKQQHEKITESSVNYTMIRFILA